MTLAELADRCEQRAIEYVEAAFQDSPWDEEERGKFWTADSLFRIAAALRARSA